MGTKPQEALNRLIAALEAHAQAARMANLSGAGDTNVLETVEERLRDAFFTYDDVLFNHYGVDLPFEMLGERDDDFYDYDELEEDFTEDFADEYDDEADDYTDEADDFIDDYDDYDDYDDDTDELENSLYLDDFQVDSYRSAQGKF
ncbi:hypothetical protein NXS08_02095 [Gleimia sp. 6138-11-ORH1]|uniref:hypothetical protein n=1 Tax=Gleimia sp. 6138-11-ORH1 TaxID=2973937 RepID=UPI00216828E8|nr:hypothetical protein [Gleimia sp. 6138-11-ORH1]MCS4484282.1 hypothetical protein [Gleimia sp. 6138-11-ORH1]